MKLVKYKDNWADEMVIEGLDVWEDKAWEAFIASTYCPESFCIGTNEEIEYEDAGDWHTRFTATNITEAEVETLNKLITFPFGHFPHRNYFKKGVYIRLKRDLNDLALIGYNVITKNFKAGEKVFVYIMIFPEDRDDITVYFTDRSFAYRFPKDCFEII